MSKNVRLGARVAFGDATGNLVTLTDNPMREPMRHFPSTQSTVNRAKEIFVVRSRSKRQAIEPSGKEARQL